MLPSDLFRAHKCQNIDLLPRTAEEAKQDKVGEEGWWDVEKLVEQGVQLGTHRGAARSADSEDFWRCVSEKGKDASYQSRRGMVTASTYAHGLTWINTQGHRYRWQPNCCRTTCNTTIAGCRSWDEASCEAMRVIAYVNHTPHGLFGLLDLIRLWSLSTQNMIIATIILATVTLDTWLCFVSPVTLFPPLPLPQRLTTYIPKCVTTWYLSLSIIGNTENLLCSSRLNFWSLTAFI